MKRQFMPVFWGDFLANTMHLTYGEIGAYFLLIAHAWENEGWVPYDRAQRIARVDNRHWGQVRARLENFFTLEPSTTALPRRYVHHRVLSELAKAIEISNKRTDAALQKHSKSTPNGHANATHTTTTLHNKLSLGEEGKPASVQMHNGRDPGSDYRSPPSSKPDNPLQPIPDRPPTKLQLERGKPPTEATRADLEAAFARKAQEPLNAPIPSFKLAEQNR